MSNLIYQEVLSGFDSEASNKIHPLILSVLEEACEHAEKAEIEENKSSIAMIAFATNLPLLKGIIDAGFQHADVIRLNYRGHSFEVSEKSEFYQQLNKLSDLLPKALE